jgi:hypothetical protein
MFTIAVFLLAECNQLTDLLQWLSYKLSAKNEKK